MREEELFAAYRTMSDYLDMVDSEIKQRAANIERTERLYAKGYAQCVDHPCMALIPLWTGRVRCYFHTKSLRLAQEARERR